MNWNHRIVRDKDGLLHLAEVYYEEDGTTPGGWSDPFMTAETLEELTETVQRLAKALEQPIVEFK